MSSLKKTLILGGLFAVAAAIGLLVLATAPIPAPSQPVEKTLNNDRFPN